MDSNPIPTKAALLHKGIIETKEMRLPLCSLGDPQASELIETLSQFQGLL